MTPFDLWPLVPESLKAVMPNVMWSRERLHALQLAVTKIAIDERLTAK